MINVLVQVKHIFSLLYNLQASFSISTEPFTLASSDMPSVYNCCTKQVCQSEQYCDLPAAITVFYECFNSLTEHPSMDQSLFPSCDGYILEPVTIMSMYNYNNFILLGRVYCTLQYPGFLQSCYFRTFLHYGSILTSHNSSLVLRPRTFIMLISTVSLQGVHYSNFNLSYETSLDWNPLPWNNFKYYISGHH